MRYVLALLLLLLPLSACAELSPAIEGALDALDLSSLEGAMEDALHGLDLRETLSRLSSGDMVWDASALLKSLFGTLMSALSGSVWRFARLLTPAILCGVIGDMRVSSARKGLFEALESACFLLLAALMAKDVGDHMALAESAITRIADLMQVLFPMLLTLLAAVGGTAGAAFYQPAVVAAGGTMTALVRDVTLPLSLAAAVLTLLNHLSDGIRIGRLAGLLKTAAQWTLGVAFTVFISVTAIQGLGVAATDGISIRAAKYTVDNFVPVVGGMFADTMDTLVGASLLIKNALGATGLIALISLAASPLMQTLAAVLVYRLCGALLEPVAHGRAAGCMNEFSGVLMLFFIIQLSIAAMFLLLIAQMLVVGNLTVMLR